jgi:predicted membrane chloride channel (bestrophin family)
MKSIFLIINIKTLTITILSVLSTFLCIKYSITANYTLTLIATAVIFPIVFSINEAYKRRELALTKYSALKAHGKAIYFATRDWLDSPTQETLDSSKKHLLDLFMSMRHLFTNHISESRKNEEAVYLAFSNLSRFIKCELRGNGLASGEVARCNQYLSKMLISFEDAKHIYQYRTPRTLKAFSTFFVLFLPALYGPYFAYEALEYSPYVTYVMPVLFTLVLASLSNIQDHLENPFDGIGEDDISINAEQFFSRLYE